MRWKNRKKATLQHHLLDKVITEITNNFLRAFFSASHLLLSVPLLMFSTFSCEDIKAIWYGSEKGWFRVQCDRRNNPKI